LRWTESAIEAVLLGAFMVSALGATALLEYPASPVRMALQNATARRAIAAVAMAVTAAAIIYSPWGRRSGAHINPSLTLTFLRLRKIEPRDAALYILAQFAGAAAGIAVASAALRGIAGSPEVNYAATVPGSAGIAGAFAAEVVISFGMMATVLVLSNTPRLAPFTGVAAACLVALYIAVESPLSGMSMNPARSLASALAAGDLTPMWIYFVAPTAGMLLAAEAYVRSRGLGRVYCAKLSHGMGPCHFRCSFGAMMRDMGMRQP
jgi:aquaporin Z